MSKSWVEQETGRVSLLWFEGEEGDGPDDAEATVCAMNLPTEPQVAVDLDVIESGLCRAIGRFSFYAPAARKLAKALVDAADAAEAAKETSRRSES